MMSVDYVGAFYIFWGSNELTEKQIVQCKNTYENDLDKSVIIYIMQIGYLYN